MAFYVNMSMYMMGLMIVTYARKIKYYLIAPQTGMDTRNTGAAGNGVPVVQASMNVQKAKIM